MDRIVNQAACVRAYLPGYSGSTIYVRITTPSGSALVDAQQATESDEALFYYTYSASAVPEQGQYTLIWSNSVTMAPVLLTQKFVVGSDTKPNTPVYRIMQEAASRVGDRHTGSVRVATTSTITDFSIIGGEGDYKGLYFILDPLTCGSEFKEIVRRVASFNTEHTITLDLPLPSIPPVGTRFYLLEEDPREVFSQVLLAMADHLDLIYPSYNTSITVAQEQDSNNNYRYRATVPVPLEWVYRVVNEDGDEVAWNDWDMRPSRVIEIDTSDVEDGDLFYLYGHIKITEPRWWDSYLNTEPGGILARVTHLLHAHHARGDALDPEEHLRRQLAALEEYDRLKRGGMDRLANGSKEVIT